MISTGFSYENLLSSAGSALQGAAPLVGQLITAQNQTPAPAPGGTDAPLAPPPKPPEVPVSTPAPPPAPTMPVNTVMVGVGLVVAAGVIWYLAKKA